MSEIPFVTQLGDALDSAIAAHTPARPARQRRLRTTLRRGRVLIAFGVVLVGGGVATAAILDQSTTTTVAAGLSCVSGTSGTNWTSSAADVPQNGDSPTAACASEMGVPAATLIACAKPVEGVVVFEADSDPADQCKSLGLAPLPTDYTAAITQIHALQQALTADYDQSDCISPSQLAQDADADLQRLGFAGWHAVIETGRAAETDFDGPCGEFTANGASISGVAVGLNASNQTVMIQNGAPRSIMHLAESVSVPTMNASGNQCYTLSGAQELVRDMLDQAAGRTVPIEFAVTKEAPNTTLMGGSGSGPYADGRQTYYDEGCTVVSGFGTASDGQTFLVTLQNNAGTLIPENAPPPASAYQSDITNG
jgi:hypothetical protein